MIIKYAIEKGVPAPTVADRASYPFAQMEVGDSFVVPEIKRGSMVCCANRFSKENPGYQFISKKVPGGVRCWRVAVEGGQP